MAEEEVFEVYEDEEGEYLIIDGERVPFDPGEYELADVEGEAEEAEEVFEVYEDEEGEYILVDGKRVPFDASEYEEVEIDEDDELYNPFDYDNVQAATDVANDIARSGAGIAHEGAALASEMKEAMDDIKSMLDIKSWLK